jgi:hypothetical protein
MRSIVAASEVEEILTKEKIEIKICCKNTVNGNYGLGEG